MGQFHTKPVTVEAVQFGRETIIGLAWIDAAIASGVIRDMGDNLVIRTSVGLRCVDHGDWIVRGIGEIEVYKPDIFAAFYEPA